jgi:hypothetical protein
LRVEDVGGWDGWGAAECGSMEVIIRGALFSEIEAVELVRRRISMAIEYAGHVRRVLNRLNANSVHGLTVEVEVDDGDIFSCGTSRACRSIKSRDSKSMTRFNLDSFLIFSSLTESSTNNISYDMSKS